MYLIYTLEQERREKIWREKICKCLILVLLMQKEEKYVKSVQQIATNFSQFMSTKANNWKKKSSKSPGMITPYFKNEGLRISKQKWKVEFFNDPRIATCQIWTTTNLNNNISCAGYAWKTRPIWKLVHDWPVWWTIGWNSGLATSRLRLQWKRSGSFEESHQESKIKKVDHSRLQIHDGHTQTVGNPATKP